jgi:hypothetical protein
VALALVANTMVAQLMYSSAGQLVLGSAFLLSYLLFSAVCSTVAFALFEVSSIFQLYDLHTLEAAVWIPMPDDWLPMCAALAHVASVISWNRNGKVRSRLKSAGDCAHTVKSWTGGRCGR